LSPVLSVAKGEGMKQSNDNLLAVSMAAAVPIYILRLQAKGGPDDSDMARAQESSAMLAERGDVLLFGGGKKGETADLFNRTAHAVAVLAFCPGGVDIFGQHFEAVRVHGQPESHGMKGYGQVA